LLVIFSTTRPLSAAELSFVSCWLVACALCLAAAVSLLWMPDATLLRVLACCRRWWRCWRWWTP
jgi:hypothetical protein